VLHWCSALTENFDKIPWPSFRGQQFMGEIDLSRPSIIDYLDCPEAEPLRINIDDILHRNNCKNIVDVGCGDGKIVERHNFSNYMGFDKERRLIARANRRYKKPNHEFRLASWDDDVSVEFDVDCLMFIGTLHYNEDHIVKFENLCALYNPRIIIIQEILQDQTYVAETNKLQAMDLTYYKKLPHKYHEFNLPIWCGHRTQFEIFYA
jgi:trans-aconitate methyltransferase